MLIADRNLFHQYKKIILFSWFFFSTVLSATSEIYSFHSMEERNQFQALVKELRCLVCQNQNLADSNSSLAKDLRQIIYQRVKNGESEAVIKNYLVHRYGEFILFKPSFHALTYCLWLLPFILFFLIVISVLVRIKKDRAAALL